MFLPLAFERWRAQLTDIADLHFNLELYLHGRTRWFKFKFMYWSGRFGIWTAVSKIPLKLHASLFNMRTKIVNITIEFQFNWFADFNLVRHKQPLHIRRCNARTCDLTPSRLDHKRLERVWA